MTQDGARSFLFLQGPSSPLFRWIADALETFGHAVHRINICAGDRVFWRGNGAVNYRGTLEAWPDYLAAFLDGRNIGEIILLGEERPHHRVARLLAAERKLPVYAVEMGYLRPDWISIEHGGSGCNSHFPASVDRIVKAAGGLPEPDGRTLYRQSFLAEAACDLAYNLPNVFLPFLHPHYRPHALAHPLAEYAGWVRKFLRSPSRARRTRAALERLAGREGDYFVYPLQLQTDYQIRVHSPFASQQDAIDTVLSSFASAAPSAARLVVKVHPLDNGLIDWPGHLSETARRLGVEARVHFVDGGDLGALLDGCRGAVMINSTVGIQAIARGKPVKALGTAIYDVPGLAHQGALDGFWTHQELVDKQIAAVFLRLLAAALHERGNFYSRAGARAGAQAIALRIHERRVNLPGALMPFPPRQRPQKRT